MKSFSRPLRSTRLFRKYFFSFINLVLVSFLILSSTLLLITTYYWYTDRILLLEDNLKRTSRLVSSVYSHTEGETLDQNQHMMISFILISNYEALGADFFLCNTRGEVIACREAISDTQAPALCATHGAVRFPTVTATFASTGEGFAHIGNPGGMFQRRMLLLFEPFSVKGKPAGFAVAAQPESKDLFSYMGGVFQMFLLASLVVFFVDFVFVYYISYRLVSPVGEMVRATKKYAKGDFGFRVEVNKKDELGLLAESFNSMAVSLATLESSRRSFVANVSHELKTPMTTIGGFIDGMRDGTIPPQDHQKYMKVVSDEVRRLSRLVTGMLNLSRMEAGELQLKRTPLDLSETLFHAALSFEQIITAKGIALVGLDTLGMLPFVGDKDMLTQVFYNLIDNAVKFTPPGERIALSAARGRSELRVSIENTGVGIAPEEITRVFERFYKTDQSRSYDVKGAGLGLHLAKTIVKMHGGTIAAESDGANYTKVIVALPVEE